MLNIILFGAPGAGKGTQAKKLVEEYGFSHISTGEVIRQEIASGSPLGKSMEGYISRGELAPDELVVDMVAKHVLEHKESPGNIFDGFPRTIPQAEELDCMMRRNGIPVDIMLSLEVPTELLVERLLIRGKDSGRADDSDEKVIRNRLDIYDKVTAIVSEYYAKQCKFIPVDGTGTVDEIYGRLSNEINKYI